MNQLGKVASLARDQLNKENEYPCPRSRLRIWSGETGSAVPSRVSLLIFILRLNLVLTYGIPPDFRGGVHFYLFKPPYAIGSTPSLSGHAIAYRWRSLPRVPRHRASKPQGNSKRALPWQVTMDQLICASLSYTHYWYEAGMLKHQVNYYTRSIVESNGLNSFFHVLTLSATGTRIKKIILSRECACVCIY